MKKTIIAFLSMVFLMCSFISAKTIINGTEVSGLIRTNVANHTSLYGKTNAYREDLYNVATKVSNYPSGLWRAKINHPKVSSNWGIVYEAMGSNYIHSFPGNGSAWSNVVMTSYTQAFHIVLNTQMSSATNTRGKLATNQSLTYVRGFTNAFAIGIYTRATNFTKGLTNAFAVKLTNQANTYTRGLTNAYAIGIYTRSTNFTKGLTNAFAIKLTNQANTYARKSIMFVNMLKTNLPANTITLVTNNALVFTAGKFNIWTNFDGNVGSTSGTNFFGVAPLTNGKIMIGGSGAGYYNIHFSVTAVCSTTNTLAFCLLQNNTALASSVRVTRGVVGYQTYYGTSDISIPANTTLKVGVCATGGAPTLVISRGVFSIRREQ